MSILDDIDVQLKTGDEAIKILVKQFIKENYDYNGDIIISDEPNKDGKYEVSLTGDVKVKNKELTSLTNEYFIWKNIGGNFYCCNCQMLESLEGAAENISGNYIIAVTQRFIISRSTNVGIFIAVCIGYLLSGSPACKLGNLRDLSLTDVVLHGCICGVILYFCNISV